MNQHNSLSTLFANGLRQLNVSLDTPSQQKLLTFLELLQKWNRSYNLTAINDPEKMVTHHLLDSLAITPFITGNHILDLGSGAGFPGIPLAVYFPEKQWTLLDSNGKKTRFLVQVKSTLGLANVTVVQDRAEQWQPIPAFDAIVIRAVGPIDDVIAKTRHLLGPRGQWLFMKSEYQSEQLQNLQPPAVIHTLNVPGISAPRYLIVLSAGVKS